MSFEYHKNLLGAELHVPGYIQSDDPGAIGAGKCWVDTSGGSGSWLVKIRNDDNTAWETLATEADTLSIVCNRGSTTNTNITIEKADPELRLTDTGDSEYTRITRSDADAVAIRYNRVNKPTGLGNCLEFDGAGSNDHVQVDAILSDLADNTTGTISVWLKVIDDGTEMYVISSSKDSGVTGNDSELFLKLNMGVDRVNAALRLDGNQEWNGHSGNGSITSLKDDWMHVVLAHNGTTPKLYINGVYYSAIYWGAGDKTKWYKAIITDATSPVDNWNIGVAEYNGIDYTPYNGKMDEVAIWSRELTADEISDLYNSGDGRRINPTDNFPSSGTPMSTNLEGLWHLDEESGTNAEDSSANENDGTLVNMDSSDWVEGKILGLGGDVETIIWKSYDGILANEEGILQVGDPDGRHVIEGKTIRFNIGGVEKLQVDADGNLNFIDTNTQVYKDGSGNLTFKDAVAGTRILAELNCPTYKYLVATSQSEGNLDLSDGTTWNVNKALIKSIKVVTASTDWDLVLYPDGDFDELGTFPSITLVSNGYENANIYLDYPYEDSDAGGEVHLKYTDNSGSNTADIYIIGYEMR